MNNPSTLFPEQKWDKIDETSRKDIHEACVGLSMGANASSMMISLRAVEYYLKRWYESVEDEEIKDETWGMVLDNLFNKFSKKKPDGAPLMEKLSDVPDVLSNIYYLKNKRNRVSHADYTPTSYETAITLFMVVGTINDVLDVIDVEES